MRSHWILKNTSHGRRVRLWAPAKINLFLKVLEKFPTGYHEIRSLMVPISLADEVEITIDPTGTGVEIQCTDPAIPTDRENLAYKAILALQEEGVHLRHVTVLIRKRIPSGAGLGGGSSNAAAVLKGIDYLQNLGLSREALRAIGLKIGADVPFFLMEQACLVSGIGERLTPLSISYDAWLVIGFPGFGISTKKAYQAIDLALTNPKAQVNMPFSLEGEVYQKDGGWKLVNDLETPVFVWYPALGLFCKELKALGALEARMTGSGSSIFGIFSERTMAETAMSKLRRRFRKWRLFLARPVWQGIDDKLEEG